jgi:hypothetical protein
MDDWTNATGDYYTPDIYKARSNYNDYQCTSPVAMNYEGAMRAQQMGVPTNMTCLCDTCQTKSLKYYRSGQVLGYDGGVNMPRKCVGSVGVLDGPRADTCKVTKMYQDVNPDNMGVPNVRSDASNDHQSDLMRQLRDLKRDLRLLGSRGYAEPFESIGISKVKLDVGHILLFIFVVVIIVFIQFSQKINELKGKLSEAGINA